MNVVDSSGWLEYFADGLLIVKNGLVSAVGSFADLSGRVATTTKIIDHSGNLIIPGMIDTHIHYPQTDIIGAYGEQLLQWLEKYTFPMERKFSDYDYALDTANFFLDELLRNGTTTALVFGTVHPESVDAFFSAAQAKKLRMIAGKVLMDRNCPDYLQDTAQTGYEQSKRLIEKWHHKDRLAYAVTPRFAPTSSSEQLSMASQLLKEHEGLYMHTHVAENLNEVEWMKSLYPEHRSYLDVYDQHDLLHARSVLAHCIHFDEQDKKRMSKTGSAVAFCATSNLFLGSGLFDVQDAWQQGIRVGAGSDVGGGSSFSMIKNLSDSYKVTQLLEKKLSAYEALYLATLGGAKALYLEDKIGNFETGKEADFVVLDFNPTPLLKRRISHCQDLHEKLFCLLSLGDDRSIAATYIMGEMAYSSTGCA